jgi:hypothetical protein
MLPYLRKYLSLTAITEKWLSMHLREGTSAAIATPRRAWPSEAAAE